MRKLTEGEKFSVVYHSIFDYPLTDEELVRWTAKRKNAFSGSIVTKGKYYLVRGKEHSLTKRLRNEKASISKYASAQSAASILAKIPSVKLVAVSGSLAMHNASTDSDIDLLIVTSANTLWITRPVVYLTLKTHGFQIRTPQDPDEKDKLCLNLWMDEQNLQIREQNIYTAHELAQLVPLINKNKTYQKLMSANKWVMDYWPNAVTIPSMKASPNISNYIFQPFNYVAYSLQRAYMMSKMTRETVTLTRAFFHPRNWKKEIDKVIE